MTLQRLMAAAVMNPLTDDDQMRPRQKDGRSTRELVNTFIKPNDRLTSFERLEIYNRQYWFRVLDCLYDDYPGLCAILGNKKFLALITAYLDVHPSQSFTLRNLGQHLIEFLEAEPKWSAPHQKIALDMARLEWAQIVAFDGETKRASGLRQIAGRPPSEIYLRLQPYITLLKLSYPVDEVLVNILSQDGRLRSEASNAVENHVPRSTRSIAGKIKPRTVRLIVHRVENSVYFLPVDAGQFKVLSAIQSGASLEAACESMATSARVSEKLASQLREWFQLWASFGWFWMK